MHNEEHGEIISLLNNIEAGIVKCDLSDDFTVLLLNDGFLRMIGYTKEEFSNKCQNSLAKLVHIDDISELSQTIKSQIKSTHSITLETRLIRSDKSSVWVLCKILISENELGKRECTLVITDISHIKEVEMELKINQKMLNFAIEQSNIIILKYDPISDTMYDAQRIMPRHSDARVVPNFTSEMLKHCYVFPDDIKIFTSLFKSIKNGEVFCGAIFRCYNKNGELLWYDVKIATILDSKGKPVQCVVALEDITEIRRLANEGEFGKSIVSDSSFAYEANVTKNTLTYLDPIILKRHPDKNLMCFTELVEHFLEYYIHKDFSSMFRNFCSKQTITDIINSDKHQNSIEYLRFDYEDKVYRWYINTMSIIRDKSTNEIKIRCYVKNIDDKKCHELELKYKSERDLLSGMYNKITAEEKISEHISLCSQTNEQCALFLVDIDKFKEINDRFGHVFGDAVISEASHKIIDSFRDNDIIGRVGGDEFIILMKNIDSLESVEKRADQLCRTLHDTYVTELVNDIISVSIGVAIFPSAGKSYKELYKNADNALYSSKDMGRDCYTMYEPSIEQRCPPAKGRL